MNETYRRLPRDFYERPALVVARELLGKRMVRTEGEWFLTGRIVETEAYVGPEDRASHAYGGKLTKRNRAVYLPGGHAYVYLIYGLHWLLNVSARERGVPECVLIRALEPCSGETTAANGPGKLCRWLRIDGTYSGEDLTVSRRLWIEEGEVLPPEAQIVATARIGIDYAGPVWSQKPWRYYLRGSSDDANCS